MLCVNGRGGESGQAHLLTFDEILGRRIEELGIGSFLEVVVLDIY
jgi:hypothetical protein